MTTEMVRLNTAPLEFTDEQRKMIRDAFANGASEQEFSVLMEVAKARRLNPLMRQIHFVSRWDSQRSRNVWATQVSIDGLRAIAERTGIYAGQDEAEFIESPDGAIKCCKVRVYRKDWGDRAAVGVAYWSEYVQTYRDKSSGKDVTAPMWRKMPHVMIAKCAEAIALRKAFPEDMSGLYTPDEMGQADNERVVDTTAETVVEARPVSAPQRRVTYPAPVASSPTMPVSAADPVRAALADVSSEQPASLRSLAATVSAEPADDDATRAAGERATLRLALLEQVSRCKASGAVVDVWIASKTERKALTTADVEVVRTACVTRVKELQRTTAEAAETWLRKAIAERTAPTPPDDGTNGPTKPRNGRDTTATGNGAANDSAAADGNGGRSDPPAAPVSGSHASTPNRPADSTARVSRRSSGGSGSGPTLYSSPVGRSNPAAAAGVRLERRQVSVAELRDAPAAWLASSIRGVKPIATLDGVALGRDERLDARLAEWAGF